MAFNSLFVVVIALMAPLALAQDTQQPQAQADQIQVVQEDRDFAAEAAQDGSWRYAWASAARATSIRRL
jgi:hypothetical protein